MTPEHRKLWCDALRSGNYEQTSGYLHIGEDGMEAAGYCCLGVLLDVIGSEEDKDNHCMDDSFSEAQLGEDWCAEHGLSFATAGTLASMNDDGASFESLAKHIEDREI